MIDPKALVRHVVIVLTTLAVFSFVALLLHETYVQPTLRWVGWMRAWNLWTGHIGQMGNHVMPAITAVVSYLVFTSNQWFRQPRRNQ